LISQLGEASKFNNGMIIVIIILHVVLFATAVFLVFYFLSEPKVIKYLLGGFLFLKQRGQAKREGGEKGEVDGVPLWRVATRKRRSGNG